MRSQTSVRWIIPISFSVGLSLKHSCSPLSESSVQCVFIPADSWTQCTQTQGSTWYQRLSLPGSLLLSAVREFVFCFFFSLNMYKMVSLSHVIKQSIPTQCPWRCTHNESKMNETNTLSQVNSPAALIVLSFTVCLCAVWVKSLFLIYIKAQNHGCVAFGFGVATNTLSVTPASTIGTLIIIMSNLSSCLKSISPIKAN